MEGQNVLLMILDGWGIGDGSVSDVISRVQPPYITSLENSPDVLVSSLKASGEDVGLPKGQMGNSEVGHLNIGAGRIVYQDLVRINKAVENNSILNNNVLLDSFKYAKSKGKKVHFLGLVSDGGVHAATPHLMKLIEMSENEGLKDIYIHVLTDGRDTDPRSGKGYINELEMFLQNRHSRIASICGRYYTMDRDKRWDRIKRGYDLLVYGKGEQFKNSSDVFDHYYEQGITDEFIEPSVIVDDKREPLATIEEGDLFICFNFRTDRLREITTVLTQEDMLNKGMRTIPLKYLTLTEYDDSFKGIDIIFNKEIVTDTIGEVLQNKGIKQIRIAETEKYPHVTFFFSGGREETFDGEKRILIPSPRDVATYDLKPAMSAREVTDSIIPELKKGDSGFICLNFANGDMVGHTGVYSAIEEAVRVVDECVERVANDAIEAGYAVVITSDHGNADHALNDDGSPNTAHSVNEVPIYILNTEYSKIDKGRLADIAPTILKIMNIDIPEKMKGKILIS